MFDCHQIPVGVPTRNQNIHPSVMRFPLAGRPEINSRHLSYYDTATQEIELIDTCYATHHLQFTKTDSLLWTRGDWDTIGWLDVAKFEETNDEINSQGWCPTVIDTNGDGQLSDYIDWRGQLGGDPADYVDENLDFRVWGFTYVIILNPLDGSVWFTRPYPD